jgi:hypothetical protein
MLKMFDNGDEDIILSPNFLGTNKAHGAYYL